MDRGLDWKLEDDQGPDPGLQKLSILYYQCFSEGAGVGVLEDLHRAFMDRLSVDEDNPDPYMTAFREGERSVVLKIMGLVKLGSVTPQQEVKDAVSRG